MTEEEKSEVTVEMTDDDSRIVEKTDGELDPKLQHEGYGRESNDVENEKNELESGISDPEFSKDKWIKMLNQVKPVPWILLSKFPTITLRYKLIIDKFKASIRDLPGSQDMLPINIKLCKSTIIFLQKQKRKNLWENYSDSMSLDQLENSLKLLFSLMISIAIELNVGLDIIQEEGGYAIEQNKKQADKSTNDPVDKEKDGDNKNKLITIKWTVNRKENKWIGILDEIQPIAPILIEKFSMLTWEYEFLFRMANLTIKTLPHSISQLPMIIKSCKRNLRQFQKDKKKGLWNDFSNISVELEQLENNLNFLFSKMLGIAVELKVEFTSERRIPNTDYKRLLPKKRKLKDKVKKKDFLTDVLFRIPID